MPIQRLAEDTIGRIAAGEVIERPAAAVKELIENALDADARRIDVVLEGGGVEGIEVRDDGAGIPFDDLPMTIERHATSKIFHLDDLSSLRTLGFRGEALASLAAVSKLTIRTIAAGQSSGGLLHVPFGKATHPQFVAWSRGTSVIARELFSNVPARRKFLRQPQTEASYVTRVVSAYALARPGVAFTLEIDGRRVFATDGTGDRINAAVAVWGSDVAEALVLARTPDDAPEGFTIQGVVSSPVLDRATRQQQFLFAQGRLISSRQLAAAFEQAYHTLLMVGRRPLGCICVTVPPDRIDVNVHPTKAEVRFADERLVFSLVQRATREAIVDRHGPIPIPTVSVSPIVDHLAQRRFALAHPDVLPAIAGVERSARSDADPTSAHRDDGRRVLPVLRVLGQIASMFVIAEGPDGMYLIDQHAAHERVIYEQLIAAYESRSPDRQLLLHPMTLDLPSDEWSAYAMCSDLLSEIGFQIDAFGGSSVVIRSVPAALRIADVAQAVLAILGELASGGRGQSQLESVAISAACHTSIRAGQPLSLLEMRELVAQLERCSSPMSCGHGRPTMLKMTADELERQFARR